MDGRKSGVYKPLYEELVDRIEYVTLPTTWLLRDITAFSRDKRLYEYQVNALENVVKLLYHFYSGMKDFSDHEIKERKKELYKELTKIGSHVGDLSLTDDNPAVKEILNYYDYEEKSVNPRKKVREIHFHNFLNRAGFWMATGSGKTLVIVKLIELLDFLITNGKIPNNDIMILTYRDDLIGQIMRHIEEYNSHHSKKIDVYDLKDYDKVKSGGYLIDKDNVNVFIYRSDLISNETKEKQLSYMDIDNNGRWYIVLDEAHKGDKEDSKRQIYYSFLARNGFLFNFSATFTDPWDIVTTVFNFNLERFIESGYGKNVYVYHRNVGNFTEFDHNEKEKVVLKALILLTAVKKALRDIRTRVGENIYHNPLMVVYGNSVNTDESDLEIFFKVLERIASNENMDNYREAMEEIIEEMSQHPRYVLGREELKFDSNFISSIQYRDILSHVYNSDSPGKIEVIKIPENDKDIVFKLKTSDRPFAMIRMGDIARWIRDKLKNYEISESYENKSYFQEINDEGSTINILMGSRTFYEGWDSNRPNVMVFVNIGVGDSKKYVLQSIGRGERIEPLKNMRKRLNYLALEDSRARHILGSLKDTEVSLAESLFVFGTKVKNIERIIESIEVERGISGFPLELRKNDVSGELLIPEYELRKLPLDELPRFAGNYHLLKEYVDWIGDDRVLYAIYSDHIEPKDIDEVKRYIRPENFRDNSDGDAYHQMLSLLYHIKTVHEDFKGFKKLEEEIIHFKRISVLVDEGTYNQLKSKVESVSSSSGWKSVEELAEKLKAREIDTKKFAEEYDKIKSLEGDETISLGNNRLRIQRIPTHYYIPVIVSEDYKPDFITHIIHEESEVKFLEALEDYIKRNRVDCDFWYFSKVDQTTDKVYIPYFNRKRNVEDKFYPDFIFWIKKGNDYRIVLVDPKSIDFTDYENKVDGYSKIFEENGKAKVFHQDGLNIRVFLFLYTPDLNKLAEGYRKYWIDRENLKKIFEAT